MAESSEATEYRVLSSVDGKAWEQSGPSRASVWPQQPDRSVVKLVVGSREDRKKEHGEEHDDNWSAVTEALEAGISDYFPNLTHLYVWGVPIKRLGPLPEGLEELDVRNAPELTRIEHLPTRKLSVLVVWNCSELTSVPPIASAASFQELEEIELRGCRQLPETWIHSLLQTTGQKLRRLDLSGCETLTQLHAFNRPLTDLRVNGCSHLRSLPGRLPKTLRRLELADTAVTKLPPWPRDLDYLNLTGAAQLISLAYPADEHRPFPRTLFLLGSGVRQPPAVLHGAAREQNVAAEALRYFRLCEQVGTAAVRRCKLLFLGNGGAGKTTLALALEGKPNPAQLATELGSTHGIRLKSRSFRPGKDAEFSDEIQIDHWDFGGQEVYHNAHAKFVLSGSLFVVLWWNKQEGQVTAPARIGVRHDGLQPLRYWLDLVAQQTGGKGRVLVVASRCNKRTDDLVGQCRRHTAGYLDDTRLMVFEAEPISGQFSDIDIWVKQQASELVTAEGESVPAHWMIAVDMVSRWLSESIPGRTGIVSFPDFLQDFAEEVRSRAQREDALSKLSEALHAEENRFVIDETIARETLHVLTNMGVLYWSPELRNEQVIIGQQWALNGIYAVLNRHEDVERALVARGGRFTRSVLDYLAWGRSQEYADPAVQELLLSFMVECNICFPLHPRLGTWNGRYYEEREYVSLKHLPTAQQMREQGKFGSAQPTRPSSIAHNRTPDLVNPFMAEYHWHNILSALGRDCGAKGQYATDGFYLDKNDKGQSIKIEVVFRPDSANHSEIYIDVTGEDAQALKESIKEKLRLALPDASGRIGAIPKVGWRLAGDLSRIVTLFVSYARNNDPTVSGDDFDYEAALNEIEKELERGKASSNIKLITNRNSLGEVRSDGGDGRPVSVPRFMDDAAQADFVLVIHSEKYWKSQYCMYEAWRSQKATQDSTQTAQNKFLFLEQIRANTDQEKLVRYWTEFSLHGRLSDGLSPSGITSQKLGLGAANFIGEFFPSLKGNDGQRRQWEPAKTNDIVKWIVERCGFRYED